MAQNADHGPLQEKFELVVRASTDAFWDWNPRTDEITRSDEYLAEFGYDPETVGEEADWWRDRIHPDDRGRVLDNLQRALADPEVTYDVTYRFRKPDRTYGHLRSRGYVVYEDGEPVRMVGAHIDVTDRERREQAVERLHETTRKLMAATNEGTIADLVVDAAERALGFRLVVVRYVDNAGERLVPAAASEAAHEILGEAEPIERGEQLGWEPLDVGEPRVVPDLLERDASVDAGNGVRSLIVVPIGEYGTLNVAATEPDAFDDVDVSLARILAANAETALDRAARVRTLRRQNERLEAFASIISHDLRNPLNVAQGRLELAREAYDSPHYEALDRALERMETLTDDLLTLARAGERVREVERVDLAAIAGEAWGTVATGDATLVADVNQPILADPSRLRQLLENLFRNAVEHAAAGTGATVTVGVLPARSGFYVADDGPGIQPERRGQVFEHGYSTTDDGTGFGLAIVREIVDAHGWNIAVTESEDGGARFEVTGVEIPHE